MGDRGHWRVYLLSTKREVVRQKVALLQSKRLYPDTGDVIELEKYDYMLGMGRLGAKDVSQAPLLADRKFQFSVASSYQALQKGKQVERIKDFRTRNDVPIYYLLYNPAVVPCEIQTPLASYTAITRAPELGARVVPAGVMLDLLDTIDYFPSVKDIDDALQSDDESAHVGGWRLEYFMSDLLLGLL